MTPVECLEAIKTKFAEVHDRENIWKEVLENMPKRNSSVRYLRKQRNKAIGLTPSLVSHYNIIVSSKTKEQ